MTLSAAGQSANPGTPTQELTDWSGPWQHFHRGRQLQGPTPATSATAARLCHRLRPQPNGKRKPHHGPGGNLPRYQQLAFERDYSADVSLEGDPHAWLLDLGVGIIPHTSGHNGPTAYSSGRALDSGSFWHHLALNGAHSHLPLPL